MDKSERRKLPSKKFSSEEDPLMEKIRTLILFVKGERESLSTDLIGQMIYTSLRLLDEGYDLGQLKLITRALKEMRYAYSIFNKYQGRFVSIFGSARTPEDHPDYQVAKAFSTVMAAKGWTCMTGGAQGIMRAGLEGAPKESAFGLSIRLPFEENTEVLLAGDPKLINFRYFFTRKLMFLSHSHALVAFPGGVGTQDELFEALTLMQTGKSNIVPLVLLEGERGTYWQAWEHYMQSNLLENGWISLEDQSLYYRASNVEDAVNHIEEFYKNYHSSRYVKDLLVIRLSYSLTTKQIAELNKEFSPLIKEGEIKEVTPLTEEKDHLDLFRIAFIHNRRHFGLLRALINRLNSF